MRTPLRQLSRMLHAWRIEQQHRANCFSISTAKLSQIVLQTANAMGGGKKPVTTNISDFLPFELNPEANSQDGETRKILSKMIKSGRIPVHVVAALSPYITPG